MVLLFLELPRNFQLQELPGKFRELGNPFVTALGASGGVARGPVQEGGYARGL